MIAATIALILITPTNPISTIPATCDSPARVSVAQAQKGTIITKSTKRSTTTVTVRLKPGHKWVNGGKRDKKYVVRPNITPDSCEKWTMPTFYGGPDDLS